MTTITRTRFKNLAAVEIRTSALKLVAVTEFGPRIAYFGRPRDGNLLLWQPRKHTRGKWDLRGGHRVWVTRPGADECEDTYATDNLKCDVELTDDGFRITGGENPVNRTRRGIRVCIVHDEMVTVDNFVINTGEMLYSGGVWALTCTVPSRGTQYGIPLGDQSEWDACAMVMFRRWAGHGEGGFADPQFAIKRSMLLINPRGVENKRMVQSHHGILAMSDAAHGLTFAKQAPYRTGGAYPLGTNMATYIGPKNFMVELETMGPERTLRPGERLHHVETWVLREGAVNLSRRRDVLKLFN
jgi:hypothetical protein